MELEDVLKRYMVSGHKSIVPIEMHVREDEGEMESRKFCVSDAGRCRLMRFWKRQGRPSKRKLDIRTRMLMEIDSLIHAWVNQALLSEGVLVGGEIEVEDSHRKGYIDAIVRLDGKNILFDFKIVSEKKMYYLSLERKPDWLHVCQILSYGVMKSFPHRDIHIVYICRDTLEMLELPVGLARIDWVIDDWAKLLADWEFGIQPKRSAGQVWECGYCIYAEVCEERFPDV